MQQQHAIRVVVQPPPYIQQNEVFENHVVVQVLMPSGEAISGLFVQAQLFKLSDDGSDEALLLPHALEGGIFEPVMNSHAKFESLRIVTRSPMFRAALRMILCDAPPSGGLTPIHNCTAWTTPFVITPEIPPRTLFPDSAFRRTQISGAPVLDGGPGVFGVPTTSSLFTRPVGTLQPSYPTSFPMYQTASSAPLPARPAGVPSMAGPGYPHISGRLAVLAGPENVAYKDTKIFVRLQLVVSGPVPAPLQADAIRVRVRVEDERSGPVRTIVTGPNAGRNILLEDEFEVQLTAHNELVLNSIRIREVSRNHGGSAFRLVFSLPDFPFISEVSTALFYVRSERIRAPSYALQLASQRRHGEGDERETREQQTTQEQEEDEPSP